MNDYVKRGREHVTHLEEVETNGEFMKQVSPIRIPDRHYSMYEKWLYDKKIRICEKFEIFRALNLVLRLGMLKLL